MNEGYRLGDVVLGKWKLIRLIGDGAYGKVFEAQREDYGMTYTAAIKIITIPQHESEIKSARAEGMDGESLTQYFRSFVEEIVREFSLMSRLKGTANIVSYEDHEVVQHESGLGWDILIRMELLTPLMDYITEQTFTRKDAIQLGIDLCRALELCQKFSIIHRDIKPENILVSKLGDFKLGDFGIARTVEKTTSILTKRGTHSYMAPEIYRGGAYGSSVDIYSLGIVLYRLLNDNRLPFLPEYPAPITHGDRESALVKRMGGTPLPTPRNVDGRLAEIILKACSYDPKGRYSSPALMRQELEAILYSSGEAQIIYPLGDETPLRSIEYISSEVPLHTRKKWEQSGDVASNQPEEPFNGEKTRSVFSDQSEEPFVREITPRVFSDPPATDKSRGHILCDSAEDGNSTTNSDAHGKVQEPSDVFDELGGKGIIVGDIEPPTKVDEQEKSQNQLLDFLKTLPGKIACIGAVVVVVAILAVVLLNRDTSPESLTNTPPVNAVESTDELQTEEWSEWMSELPSGINSDDYIVEARTLYRSAPAKSSTESDIPDPGYSLYSVSYGAFGEWSDWQEEEVIESDTLEVEVETKYQHLQYYTYTYYVTAPNGTKWPREGTGSRWVEGYNANSSNNQSWDVYRYRERTITYYFCRENDWSDFSDTPIHPSALTAVNTSLQYRYIQKDAEYRAESSMDNFPTQFVDYSNCFVDVDDNQWYGSKNSGCIGTAFQIGAVVPDVYMFFRPEAGATIAEVIRASVVIHRIYSGEQGILPETSIWYQVYVDYAIENNLIAADDFSDYTTGATRAEAAYIIRHALPLAELEGINIVFSIDDMETDSKYFKSVYQLAQAGVISWPTPSYSFRPENTLTRAEVAAFVDRLINPENRVLAE